MPKPELDLDAMGTTAQAGPMPKAVRARLKTRRNFRRRRMVGGVMVITGVGFAVTLWMPRTPDGTTPTGPIQPAPELVLGPVELRFDDPMFLAMDRAEDTRGGRRESGQTRWRIGSHLLGDWPSDL